MNGKATASDIEACRELAVEHVQTHFSSGSAELILSDAEAMRQFTKSFLRNFSLTVTRPNIPSRIRLYIFERDGFACCRCDSREQLSIDHIVPVSRGGSNDIENLQTLCMPCNTAKGVQ